MEAIEIRNLAFHYGKQAVLDGLRASFCKGELSVILGRNGSGKSTLFNILAGVQREYQGQIHINGVERRAIKVGNANGIRLGFMTQFHQTNFPFSVYDVVMTGRASFSRFSPKEEDREQVQHVLKRFDLWKYKDKPYTRLSGGERQLVLLCRVLVQDPDIILLDEPTNHLDLHYQVAVLDNLKKLVEAGKTVICIMHDPNLAFLYGDRFFLMQQQVLTSLEGKNTASIHHLLEQAYQVRLEQIPHRGKIIILPSPQHHYE